VSSSYGRLPSSLNLLLFVLYFSRTAPCEICLQTDVMIRCASPARRDMEYNLTVIVAGQRSVASLYSYEEIMRKPVVASISPLRASTEVGVCFWCT
jgi:hypothetical protein